MSETGKRLWRRGAFVADDWVTADDQDRLPEGNVIVTLDRLKAESDNLLSRATGRAGVRLEADDDIAEITGFLDRLSLVALAFPAFTDGRAYSKAVRLRQHHGFAGEIRAVGDILLDQVAFMQRCGFDALEVDDESTVDRLQENNIPAIDSHYQPALDSAKKTPTYSWRRSSASAA